MNGQGNKELRGLWRAATEGAKIWRSCRTDLKDRGVEDIFLVGGVGWSGFPEAIRAAFPATKVQRGIVHVVRAALAYTTDKESRAGAAAGKTISPAAPVLEAEQMLDQLEQKGGEKYPPLVKQWRLKWLAIIALFAFPQAIRQAS